MVRRPKYLTAARDGHRWLISYTDVLTLLLILFIAVAAQAVSKTETRTAVSEAPPTSHAPLVTEQPAAQAPAPVSPPQVPIDPPANTSNEKLIGVEARLKEHGLDAKRDARGLVISLPQAVLFRVGRRPH
jgi:hypothetical protein